MKSFLISFLVFSLFFINDISAKKIIVSRAGFTTSNGDVVSIHDDGPSAGGLALDSAVTDGVSLLRFVQVPHGYTVKNVKAFVKLNSAKRLSIVFYYVDIKTGDRIIIAQKDNLSDLNSSIQKIALDMVISDHVINTKKYEYIAYLSFEDGGDDDNLTFYGMKINVE